MGFKLGIPVVCEAEDSRPPGSLREEGGWDRAVASPSTGGESGVQDDGGSKGM